MEKPASDAPTGPLRHVLAAVLPPAQALEFARTGPGREARYDGSVDGILVYTISPDTECQGARKKVSHATEPALALV